MIDVCVDSLNGFMLFGFYIVHGANHLPNIKTSATPDDEHCGGEVHYRVFGYVRVMLGKMV